MRCFLLEVLCVLSVSMSFTMSAQADINDFTNGQVSGKSVYIQYDYQMMLDSIDVLNSIQAFSVDTVLLQSDGSYEVQFSNGTTASITLGCTDPSYTEYDASANTDDGSCFTPVAAECTVPATDLTCYQVAYLVTAEDEDGGISGAVVDLYVDLPQDGDVLLAVSQSMLSVTPASVSFFQSTYGAGWEPVNFGTGFDNSALRQLDSFVTIGGFDVSATPEQVHNSGMVTGLDPNFGDNFTAAPGAGAGWYNANTNNVFGLSQDLTNVGLTGVHGVFIGRFTTLGSELSLEGSTFVVAWNQGSGTDSNAQTVTVCAEVP